ncbi:hypothetical protein [Haladaptatus litoreus]|nr:hypothetical protein [Haladaptatus litoreus]
MSGPSDDRREARSASKSERQRRESREERRVFVSEASEWLVRTSF